LVVAVVYSFDNLLNYMCCIQLRVGLVCHHFFQKLFSLAEFTNNIEVFVVLICLVCFHDIGVIKLSNLLYQLFKGYFLLAIHLLPLSNLIFLLSKHFLRQIAWPFFHRSYFEFLHLLVKTDDF